ncbi:MAG: hypothetical protein R3C05_30140 [Pirellulaceae bacterium]
MKEGVSKRAPKTLPTLGRELERATRAGYGSTVNPESVQKLVDAIKRFSDRIADDGAELQGKRKHAANSVLSKKEQETLSGNAVTLRTKAKTSRRCKDWPCTLWHRLPACD